MHRLLNNRLLTFFKMKFFLKKSDQSTQRPLLYSEALDRAGEDAAARADVQQGRGQDPRAPTCAAIGARHDKGHV